jgi:hypothetical protein
MEITMYEKKLNKIYASQVKRSRTYAAGDEKVVDVIGLL